MFYSRVSVCVLLFTFLGRSPGYVVCLHGHYRAQIRIDFIYTYIYEISLRLSGIVISIAGFQSSAKNWNSLKFFSSHHLRMFRRPVSYRWTFVFMRGEFEESRGNISPIGPFLAKARDEAQVLCFRWAGNHISSSIRSIVKRCFFLCSS